jgi:predicted metal-binding membrane protein
MTTARAATVWIPGLAAACWALTARQMSGMDMGTSSELGSFSFFAALWVSMMAAMMLPGAVPAVARAGRGLAGPLFAASYVGVWALFGLAVYALYRPHGVAAAGALTIGAGLYELTPLKRECRRRCRRDVRSGFQFGVYCVGSSVGLMVMLVALGVMSLAWMAVVTALVLAQKLLPPQAWIDVPVALAITTLGMVMFI